VGARAVDEEEEEEEVDGEEEEDTAREEEEVDEETEARCGFGGGFRVAGFAAGAEGLTAPDVVGWIYGG
jgi:hypothetical protein